MLKKEKFIEDQIVFEHHDHNLRVIFGGEINQCRINDTIFNLNNEYDFVHSEQHTKLISFIDTKATEQLIIDACASIVSKTSMDSCAAIAIVVPNELAFSIYKIDALTNDAHNGVRSFFNEDQANIWLLYKIKLFRKRSLH